MINGTGGAALGLRASIAAAHGNPPTRGSTVERINSEINQTSMGSPFSGPSGNLVG